MSSIERVAWLKERETYIGGFDIGCIFELR